MVSRAARRKRLEEEKKLERAIAAANANAPSVSSYSSTTTPAPPPDAEASTALANALLSETEIPSELVGSLTGGSSSSKTRKMKRASQNAAAIRRVRAQSNDPALKTMSDQQIGEMIAMAAGIPEDVRRQIASQHRSGSGIKPAAPAPK